MAKRWYIVHTYSGFEKDVKDVLEKRIKNFENKDLFGEVIIPTETIVEMIKGKEKRSERKFFPGYVLVNMELNDETWHLVRKTPKVTGFVGKGTHLPSLSDEEVQKINLQIAEGLSKPKPKVHFEKGEGVRVLEGVFSNFNGIVEEVIPEKGRIKILVNIFGRYTPVTLEFSQVEKT